MDLNVKCLIIAHQEKNKQEVVEVCARSTQRVGDDAHTRVEGQHLRRCDGRGHDRGVAN